MNKEVQIKLVEESKKEIKPREEPLLRADLNDGKFLRGVYKRVGVIEEIILKSCISLDVSFLNELPDDENIIYNENNHKDNLISELKYDFKKLKIKGDPPLRIRSGKCDFCYPNNITYTFHNSESDELILRVVIDKLDDNNYIVMVCENKSKPKLKSPSINNDFPF